MSYFRKLIGAAFVMVAVQTSIPGVGFVEWVAGLFSYLAVLVLFPSSPSEKDTPA